GGGRSSHKTENFPAFHRHPRGQDGHPSRLNKSTGRGTATWRPMSALGQKQTFAPQNVMSALLPKADSCSAEAHVCFGPIADITSLYSMTLSARGIRCARTTISHVVTRQHSI